MLAMLTLLTLLALLTMLKQCLHRGIRACVYCNMVRALWYFGFMALWALDQRDGVGGVDG